MRTAHCAFLALVSAAAWSIPPLGAWQAPGVSRDRLVAAGVEYVSAYQDAFAFLLADEAAVQRVWAGPSAAAMEQTALRTTRAEVFITYLERTRHWTTVRDVAEVDGVPVGDRTELAELIAREEPSALARRLFAVNARYNIGRVARNFNDPMLALLALNPHHRPRFALDVGRMDRTGPGAALATLRFRERERPTLVRSTTGASVYAQGDILMDPSSGAIHRTRMAFEYDDIDAELVTEFTRDERLGLWVPRLCTERYVVTRDNRRDETTVESRYSNYRRFDVRARILP